MSSQAYKVVKNTWILYIRMAITVFISLYATRLTLAALGVNDFGIFNLVGGIIAMLTFLNTAMAGATQRFMSFAEGAGDHHKQKEIFNVSTVLHIIIAILVLFLLEGVGYFLFNSVLKIPIERIETAKLVFHFMVISTVFTIISVPYDAVINAHENMLLFAILGVIDSVFKLAIALYLSISTIDKLTTFGFLMAVLSVFMLILRRLYCNRTYSECDINLKAHFNKNTFKEMSSFAGWSLLGASSSMISNYGQGLVLNMFFGTIVNAAQGISNQVSGQLGVFSGTMLKALNPIIAKSEGSGNRALMLKATLFGTKTSFFLLLIFYVPVLIDMSFIFKIWLNKLPQFTIIFCRLLLIRNLIEQLYITLGASISAVGNIKNYQIFKSLLSMLPLGAAFLLFYFNQPPYTIYVVFIFYAVLDAMIVLSFAKRYCGLQIRLFLNDILFPCVSIAITVLIIAFIPYYFLPVGILRLAVICGFSFSTLVTMIWYFGLKKDEKKMILAFFNNMIKKVSLIKITV